MGEPSHPSRPLRYALKVGVVAGLTASLCCVAPAVLFLVGLVGAISAVSFADAFYQPDGSAGPGAWALRIVAAGVAATAIAMFARKQRQCSIDPKRRRKNLILVAVGIPLAALAVYLGLERLSTSFFDRMIVPEQQRQLRAER